ncbi:hypothetical protein [Sphingomonas sp.]|uniref:polysaccharide deacetylase family protein n=1 Tax=Sphingomonas sp. TaxID=28214 RepID=UPI0025FD7EE7|nr:hypothetical protein [Sphingomonas sp.]
MTAVLITVDTELSARLHRLGTSAQENFDLSVLGRCGAGHFGIEWQMHVLDRHGLKGIYFVDPMPSLVLGEAVIASIVERVLARGHEVQLHCHPEWLEWAIASPVEGRRGRNIADFPLADQISLLDYGCGVLERAGAPRPTAFRAGNFGANDDTLRAVAAVGLTYDSSVNADFLRGDCQITIPAGQNSPVEILSTIELPVSGLYDRPGHFRPAQVCAMSDWEMRAMLDHAATIGQSVATIVTHSFEMLSRDRQRPNWSVIKRFDRLAKFIGSHPRLESATFGTLDPAASVSENLPRRAPNIFRTVARTVEQVAATVLYERTSRS